MNNSEGQTQEPVGGMRWVEASDRLPPINKDVVIKEYSGVLDIGWQGKDGKIHTSSDLGPLSPHQVYWLEEFTPPPAPIKTEGEDAEQAAANWQKQNEKFMPDEQSESMLYDSFIAGVEWKSASLPQSSTEEEKDLWIGLFKIVSKHILMMSKVNDVIDELKPTYKISKR